MIIYFSGTGNSRLVADSLISEGIPGQAFFVNDVPEEIAPSDSLIWVFPVYGWRIPEIIADSMARLVKNRKNYMVATCGDDIGRVAEQWRKIVEQHGGYAEAAFSVQMPNTYVCLPGFDVDSVIEAEAKLARMPQRVSEIALKIKTGNKSDDVVTGSFPSLKSGLLGGFFKRYLMSPKGFSVDQKKCTGCKRCISACPVNNMSFDKLPEWGNQCQFCLACYHSCPHSAINHGIFTKGKGHYLAPSVHSKVVIKG